MNTQENTMTALDTSNHPTNPSFEEAQELQLGDTITVESGAVSVTGEIVDYTAVTETLKTFIFENEDNTYKYTVDTYGSRLSTHSE